MPTILPLTRFWLGLDRVPGLTAVEAEWRAAVCDDLDRVRDLLHPEPGLAESFPHQGRAGEVYAVVVHGPDDIVGVGPDGDRIARRRGDVTAYRLSVPALLLRLAALFAVPPDAGPVAGLGRTWRVGVDCPTAGYGFPLFLALGQEPADYRRDVAALAAAHAGPFRLLSPTNRHVRYETTQLLAAHESTFLALADAVAWAPDRWDLTPPAGGGPASTPATSRRPTPPPRSSSFPRRPTRPGPTCGSGSSTANGSRSACGTPDRRSTTRRWLRGRPQRRREQAVALVAGVRGRGRAAGLAEPGRRAEEPEAAGSPRPGVAAILPDRRRPHPARPRWEIVADQVPDRGRSLAGRRIFGDRIFGLTTFHPVHNHISNRRLRRHIEPPVATASKSFAEKPRPRRIFAREGRQVRRAPLAGRPTPVAGPEGHAESDLSPSFVRPPAEVPHGPSGSQAVPVRRPPATRRTHAVDRVRADRAPPRRRRRAGPPGPAAGRGPRVQVRRRERPAAGARPRRLLAQSPSGRIVPDVRPDGHRRRPGPRRQARPDPGPFTSSKPGREGRSRARLPVDRIRVRPPPRPRPGRPPRRPPPPRVGRRRHRPGTVPPPLGGPPGVRPDAGPRSRRSSPWSWTAPSSTCSGAKLRRSAWGG
ncbi:hypothetical protein PX52LOC_07878 [Limnoglobus roseus]|uniref:Uncharacterized protein n=1 Tax=Limnoglobus roseus TaxID=2598579 RepID=A0A5C1AU61_9BACT|nr:hypothetical protein PX52LOC_07878 [Limnoglobus roseus]